MCTKNSVYQHSSLSAPIDAPIDEANRAVDQRKKIIISEYLYLVSLILYLVSCYAVCFCSFTISVTVSVLSRFLAFVKSVYTVGLN